jgi:integrator complex subunit 6
MNSVVPGSELTKEPFRWDQRVFSIVLQFPASIPPDSADFPQIPNADRAAIDSMCVATAGKTVF